MQREREWERERDRENLTRRKRTEMDRELEREKIAKRAELSATSESDWLAGLFARSLACVGAPAPAAAINEAQI